MMSAMNRIIAAIIWTFLIGGACFGQSSFQEITPGATTRKDVEKALGQPVRTISAARFEYKAPAGSAKVEVEYVGGSFLAERMQVYFLKAISRSALIPKLSLPQPPETNTANADGKLSMAFGE